MHPRHYRTRLLSQWTRSILYPLVISFLIGSTLLRDSSQATRTCLHILIIPLVLFCKSIYASYWLEAQARRFGADPIPKVIGKLPGNIDIMLRMLKSLKTGYVMQFMQDIMEEYHCKTLNLRILWDDFIITMDESHVKYMLTGDGFDWFKKGYWWQERIRYWETGSSTGKSNLFPVTLPLITSWEIRDDTEWSVHRALLKPFFSKERISDFELFSKHSTTLCNIIKSKELNATGVTCAIDIQDLFSRLTLDVSSEFLFGECLHTLSQPIPEAGKALLGPKGSVMPSSSSVDFSSFASAFERIQLQIAIRTRIGKNWPVLELFKDKTKRDRNIMKSYLQPIVNRAMKNKNNHSNEDAESEDTFLSYLVRNAGDEETIRHEILNLLVAGRDTTSTLLTFSVYFLCLHPEKMSRLREEIVSIFGFGGDPSYESLRKLKYMRAFLNEVLRLFPPVPMNIRVSDPHNARCLPGPVRSSPPLLVPPGSQIIYNTMLIQRRKDLWGEDAELFEPERWLDEARIERTIKNPFIFVPFHAGPRICLGQNFAYAEASFVLVRLLQTYADFELAPNAQPSGSLPLPEWKKGKGRQAIEQCWPASAVTLFIKGGLWIKCHKTMLNSM